MNSEYFPNFMKKGSDFTKFWKEYLDQDRKVLFILGLGFDPRALSCLKIIHKNGLKTDFNYMVIRYDDPAYGLQSAAGRLLKQNEDGLDEIVPRELWNEKLVRVAKEENMMSIDAARSISESDLEKHTDIIIDISAMPIGVYFPIMRQIFRFIKMINQSNGKKINCHLVVSESAKLDELIKDTESGERATIMYQFMGYLQLESKKDLPKVWIPILGKNKNSQLEKIHAEISPSETSPVFPMPSTDPYRSRDLLLEYSEFLFDVLDINPGDFLYSSECNPFETCRKIYKTARLAYALFEELGGCQIVLSPLSSKLLCVGCLLAACKLLDEEADVGIAHVENQGYDFDEAALINENQKGTVPVTLWLTGECYAR